MKDFVKNIPRRAFLQTSGLAAAAVGFGGCASSGKLVRSTGTGGKSQKITGTSSVVLEKNSDRRQGTYNSLKPLQADVAKEIGQRQVIIKVNAGFPTEEHRIHSTYPEQIEGILDFLSEFYDGEIVIAEGVGSSKTNDMMDGYRLFGYMPIKQEFPNITFVDANSTPVERKWIRQWHQYPVPIDIISMYFNPNNYIISAARFKTHNCVVGTYSLKNIIMGSPIGNYRNNKSQKGRMHGGRGVEGASGRELSYNMFTLALAGVYPDLAVVDGTTGIEGNGPWDGTAVDHNISVASTDFVACDRVCTELMGIDPFLMKYLEWCGDAELGNWDMDRINITGARLEDNVIKYKMNKNFDSQVAWIHEHFEKES